MRERKTAAQILIDVMNNDRTMNNRVRTKPVEICIVPRQAFPTGELDVSVGMVRNGQWWNAQLFFTVGNILVCKLRSLDNSLGSTQITTKQLMVSEVFTRPGGERNQILSKKDDEYKILQEIVKDVHDSEKAQRDREADEVAAYRNEHVKDGDGDFKVGSSSAKQRPRAAAKQPKSD